VAIAFDASKYRMCSSIGKSPYSRSSWIFTARQRSWLSSLDGSQHFETVHQAEDRARDAALAGLGLQVLRFDNRQVLLETDAVLAAIDEAVKGRM